MFSVAVCQFCLPAISYGTKAEENGILGGRGGHVAVAVWRVKSMQM